ncbi:hypothetical protein [Brevibacillus brevis]|uniref:hypothetical protein n=1 Tax=Brevibacillus brevis TaxID=1393 RepID=UPI00163D3CB5
MTIEFVLSKIIQVEYLVGKLRVFIAFKSELCNEVCCFFIIEASKSLIQFTILQLHQHFLGENFLIPSTTDLV